MELNKNCYEPIGCGALVKVSLIEAFLFSRSCSACRLACFFFLVADNDRCAVSHHQIHAFLRVVLRLHKREADNGLVVLSITTTGSFVQVKKISFNTIAI